MDQEYTDMEINTNIVDSTQETYILVTEDDCFSKDIWYAADFCQWEDSYQVVEDAYMS